MICDTKRHDTNMTHIHELPTLNLCLNTKIIAINLASHTKFYLAHIIEECVWGEIKQCYGTSRKQIAKYTNTQYKNISISIKKTSYKKNQGQTMEKIFTMIEKNLQDKEKEYFVLYFVTSSLTLFTYILIQTFIYKFQLIDT